MSSSSPWAIQHWAYKQKVGHPIRKLILTALATMAETNTGVTNPRQEKLAEYAECTTRTVRVHLAELERLGLLRRRPTRVGARRGIDEYLLLATGITGWPDVEPEGSSASTRASTGTLKSFEPEAAASGPYVNDQGTTNGIAKAMPPSGEGVRARAKVDQDVAPEGFPDELRPVASKVLKILNSIYEQRGGLRPRKRGLGLVMLRFLDRPFKDVADELEYWAVSGDGHARPIRDWVKQYANFLGRTAEGAPSRNGTPARRGQNPKMEKSRAERRAAAERLIAQTGLTL